MQSSSDGKESQNDADQAWLEALFAAVLVDDKLSRAVGMVQTL